MPLYYDIKWKSHFWAVISNPNSFLRIHKSFPDHWESKCFSDWDPKLPLCLPSRLDFSWKVLVTQSCPVSNSLQPPWIVACQAPLSMGFSKQEYWSGSPFSFPGNLPDPGIKPRYPVLQAGSLPSKLPGKPPFHGRTAAKPKTNTQKLVLVDSGSQYEVHIGK